MNETMFSAIARRTNSPDFIIALLKGGADPDFTGKTGILARMTALSTRKADIADLFITQDCDYGRKDKSGDTLLHLAFSNKYPEIAKKVLENRIPAKVINENGSDGTDGEIVTGSDLKNYRREAEIVNVMSAIGNHDVLHCLCNYGRVSHGGASSSVGISFSPGATGLAPAGECGRNQRGSCFASGWSCWHFTMPTDDEGLRRCGYAKALKNARDKHNAIKSAIDETRLCNADYDLIIKEAKRKEMEIKKSKRESGEL